MFVNAWTLPIEHLTKHNASWLRPNDWYLFLIMGFGKVAVSTTVGWDLLFGSDSIFLRLGCGVCSFEFQFISSLSSVLFLFSPCSQSQSLSCMSCCSVAFVPSMNLLCHHKVLTGGIGMGQEL